MSQDADQQPTRDSERSSVVSEESSGMMIVSPRTFSVQVLDTVTSRSISTVEIPVDASKSTITLHVSRGKSHVNLGDPSKVFRRAPSRRFIRESCSPDPIPIRLKNDKRNVKFLGSTASTTVVSQPTTPGCGAADPKTQLFPSTVLEMPFSNLKEDYDFYAPGQTLESVKNKVDKVKHKMEEMRDSLKRVRVQYCNQPSTSAVVPTASDDVCKVSAQNTVSQPTSNSVGAEEKPPIRKS